MHPVVALVAAEAGKAVGKEIAKEIISKIFGKSGNLPSVQKALTDIKNKLEAIDKNLSHLTTLVNDLPHVIIGEYKRERANEAYYFIRSAEIMLFNNNRRGRIKRDELLQISLLNELKIIFENEDRPEKLMFLPYIAEFVRLRCAGMADFEISAHVQAKSLMLERSIEGDLAILSQYFLEADGIGASQYFSSYSSTASSPFLSWTLAEVPQISVSVPYPQHDPVNGYSIEYRSRLQQDSKWAEAQSSLVNRLFELRKVIEKENREYLATLPAYNLLRIYASTLPTPKDEISALSDFSVNEISLDLEFQD